MTRTARLGALLERLETAERERGVSWCAHSSWIAVGEGFVVALVRPGGWDRGPLGIPATGYDLERVLERACEIAERQQLGK